MRPNTNLIYDVTTGLSGNVVMSIAESKEKEIYVGSLEHGLSIINEAGQAITLNEPGRMGENVKINSSANSYDGSVWIGTIGSGLWNLSKSKNIYKSVQLYKEPQNVISLYEHTDSALWIGTPRGLLRYKNESLKKIKGINNSCFAIAPYINDSILIGTGAGLRVIHENADSGGFFFLSELNTFLVGAIKNYDTYLAFGTSENGIVAHRPQAGIGAVHHPLDASQHQLLVEFTGWAGAGKNGLQKTKRHGCSPSRQGGFGKEHETIFCADVRVARRVGDETIPARQVYFSIVTVMPLADPTFNWKPWVLDSRRMITPLACVDNKAGPAILRTFIIRFPLV